jgi:pyridoxamine 5'-phosphate oxidase
MNFPTEIIERFEQNMQAAQGAGEPEPTAMSLATSGAEGKISVRTMLLKDFDETGFVFYTNTLSNKGQQLAQHPQAALCFVWKSIFRQVQVEGKVETVTDAEADAYFATRPSGSQVGAWASMQSETLDSRETLVQREAEYEQKFAGMDVPRPPHWSGYRVLPEMIEFWYGMENRLHDRFRFTLKGGEWQKQRLYP